MYLFNDLLFTSLFLVFIILWFFIILGIIFFRNFVSYFVSCCYFSLFFCAASIDFHAGGFTQRSLTNESFRGQNSTRDEQSWSDLENEYGHNG